MDTFNLYRSQRYFSSLDGVRFFSILAVVWHHSTPEGFSGVWHKGFLGVDMFFVLSGYLIVTLLLREKNANNGSISLKNFYIRRMLRIFPIYFGVLLALTLLYGVLKPNDPDTNTLFSLLPVYLLFLSNWSIAQAPNLGIYWSLATEEQFYVFWPMAEKFMRSKGLIGLLIALILINQLINFGYFDSVFVALYGSEEVLKLSILEVTFTPILLGVLLAHMLHTPSLFSKVYAILGSRYSSLLLFFMLIVAITASTGDISGWQRFSFHILMTAWLASLVVREDHFFRGFMTFYPIKRMGQISYGMYVYHMLCAHVMREVLIKFDINFTYAFFIGTLLLTVVVSELSFRLYEKPILSFNKKFRMSSSG